MLFYNGRIVTMDPNMINPDYLVIEGNKILKVGFGALQGNEVSIKKYDLRGKMLMPGFFDTHLHLLNYGSVLRAVNLRGCTSINELTLRLKERVKTVAKGEWIFGQGWDENCYGGVLPSRSDLDKVAPDHPVLLSRVCGHLVLLNSFALQKLSIKENTPSPAGGAIDRDVFGQLTGVFRENAVGMVYERLPRRSMAEIEELLVQAGKSVLSQGITTVHTDDMSDYDDISPIFTLFRRLWREGKVPRTHLHIRSEHLQQAHLLGMKTGQCQDGITVGAVKIFVDGSLGARTAAMLEDYSDASGEKGMLVLSDEQLYQMVNAAHKADFTVAIHGIGDAANAQAVRIICKVQDENPKPYLRHRLVHAQILNEEIMAQMAKYKIIGEIQPIFINTDMHWAENRVGKRIKTSYNWQTMWQKGIYLTGSSDCPVEPVNPLYGIYSSVTRKDLQGHPTGGWYPAEALNLKQALQLFTMCGAYTGSEELIAGSLTERKNADLVILNHQLENISPEEIKDVKVLATIMDGRVVYGSLD